MYPEDYSNFQSQQQRPNKKPIVIICVVVGLLLIGALITLVLRQTTSPSNDAANIADPNFKLTSTALKSDRNFSQIKGDELFSYNGAAFYKQSLSSGQITILSRGVKLPKPTNISWVGSKGAVMTFSDGFVGTRVYDALRTQNQIVNSTTKAYAWYFDFGSGSISQLSGSSLASNDIVVSANESGFYYVGPAKQDSRRDTTMPLSFYDIAARKSTVISADLNVDYISHLSGCMSNKFCFTGKDVSTSKQTKIYSVDQAGKKEEIISISGNIYPSNDPNKFALAEGGTEEGDAYSLESQSGEMTNDTNTDREEAEVNMIDVTTKAKSDLGFMVGLSTVFPYFYEDKFIALDSSYNANEPRTGSVEKFQLGYRAGVVSAQGTSQSKLFPMVFKDNTPYESKVISVSYGKSAILLTNPKLEMMILSNAETPDMNITDAKTVKSQVESCLGSAGAGSSLSLNDAERTFTVNVAYDDNFNTKLGSFSNCLAGKGSSTMNGYNYSFIGRDPRSQRVVTD